MYSTRWILEKEAISFPRTVAVIYWACMYQVYVQHCQVPFKLSSPYKTPVEQMKKLRFKYKPSKLPRVIKSVNGLCYWQLHFIPPILKRWSLNWQNQHHLETCWKSKSWAPTRPTKPESLVVGPRNLFQPALQEILIHTSLRSTPPFYSISPNFSRYVYFTLPVQILTKLRKLTSHPFICLSYVSNSHYNSNHNSNKQNI